MELDKLKNVVLEALDDLKAKDVQVIDVRGKSNFTDLMIVATGTSSRQVKSMADHVWVKAKENSVVPLGLEGEDTGEWVLVDLGDIVVHIMLEPIRQFYQLERLWTMPEGDNEAANGTE